MTSLTLGVDLGGTKVRTALVDPEGNIVFSHQHPTNRTGGYKGVISDIVSCVRNCLSESSMKAIALGMGVAGQVDASSGTVLFAPNLGWRDVPLQSELEKALQLPVVVANDVRAATVGEWYYGAGQGIGDIVCIFVGTGIGGGVISGGRLLEGATNSAGELGHITIVTNGRPCHCPNLGCLEAYAGGWAIAERAIEAVNKDPEAGRMLVELAGSANSVTAATVGEAYIKEDSLARRLVEKTGMYLASGIVGLINAFNPALLILGGGVIEKLPVLISIVEQGVQIHALQAANISLLIEKARLGNNAGVIGAATLSRMKALGEVNE